MYLSVRALAYAKYGARFLATQATTRCFVEKEEDEERIWGLRGEGEREGGRDIAFINTLCDAHG